MHEFSVCRELLIQVEKLAADHEARAIGIKLHIGALSGIEGPLLERAFPLASAGTRAEGAALHIVTCPVVVRCRACGRESEVPPNRLVCPACDEWRTDVIAGTEMLLASVELECIDQEASIV